MATMGLRRYTITLAVVAVTVLLFRVAFYYFAHNPTLVSWMQQWPDGTMLSYPFSDGSLTNQTLRTSVTSQNQQHAQATAGRFGAGNVNAKAPVPAPLVECVGDEWCSIAMPSQSLFRFPPPTDRARWARAQRQAISGEPVLLQHVLPHFPNHLDYLDGDVWFRQYHKVPDAFVDHLTELRLLTNDGKGAEKIAQLNEEIKSKRVDKYTFLRDQPSQTIVRPISDLHALGRAPVVQLGYHGFGRGNHGGSSRALPLYGGPILGEAIIDRGTFLSMYNKYKSQITLPWIAMHSANENWGILSTYFPNRTVDWGTCCTSSERQTLQAFLDDKHTLMFLINQHSNISHPKLLTFPRGIPLHNDGTQHLMFNAQRSLAKSGQKTDFLFTASSNWGPRPRISQCIAKKFQDTKGVHFAAYGDDRRERYTPEQYYQKLGTAKFSIALPGLGYDTHRLWESMLLGTIPVLEKGIGLDKTLWRLPALLVDDFDLVTPELLRQAYLEALYRAEDFEFDRLKQSFWFSFIANVSLSMDSATIQLKFPLESEMVGFARPFETFRCQGACGKGTLRTPVESC